MKKFLALLLAAMMLLSCTSALAVEISPVKSGNNGVAISFTENGTDPDNPDSATDNSKLEIDQEHISRYVKEDGTEGTVSTELWMQVDASGQIDVTVPLVLVFSTNVDGGKATEATNYKIYNNNVRNSIAVDKITVAQDSQGVANTTFVSKTEFEDLDDNARDYYYVILEPEVVAAADIKVSDNQTTLKSLAMNTQVHVEEYDLHEAQSEDKYNETADKATSLMTLGQGGEINLKPTMVTTPLTFVTTGYNETENGDADEATKGIKLLTVTYTVGLKYNTVTGADITGTDVVLPTTGN